MGTAVGEICRELDRVIDELLDVDPHELDADELHESGGVDRTVRRRVSPRCERVTSPCGIPAGCWASNGASYGGGATGQRVPACRGESAATEMRRATQAARDAATFDALARGEISVDHVDLLGRANYGRRGLLFPEAEKLLVDACATMRYSDAARAVAYWRQHADAAGADGEGDELVEQRHLSASRTFDGSVYLQGLLDPVGGTVFLDELARLERMLYETERAAGEIIRTTRQRRPTPWSRWPPGRRRRHRVRSGHVRCTRSSSDTRRSPGGSANSTTKP